MELFLNELVANHPNFAGALLVIGILRAIFKPLQGVIEAYVNATLSNVDNEKWDKIKASRIFKGLAWLIDFTASIKIPGHK